MPTIDPNIGFQEQRKSTKIVIITLAPGVLPTVTGYVEETREWKANSFRLDFFPAKNLARKFFIFFHETFGEKKMISFNRKSHTIFSYSVIEQSYAKFFNNQY
jgi:hypothetical protein